MEYLPTFSDQLDVDYISHHGILGQKWGVRRFQNPDGTLTNAGIKRYRKKLNKALDKADASGRTKNREAATERYMREWMDTESSKKITEFDKKYGINLDPTKGPITMPIDANGRVPDRIMSERNALFAKYEEEGKRIMAKHSDDIAGALLRDIGEKDTKKGRLFVRRYFFEDDI